MKQTTIGKVKDGEVFQLSKRSKVIYQVILRKGKLITFTSTSSNKSFIKQSNTVCYV